MRLCAIASGSSGNCIFLGTDRTQVLVDVGICRRQAEDGLAALNLGGRDIDGILITHEHSDHVGGLGVFCRKYHTPVYGTAETLAAVRSGAQMRGLPEQRYVEVSQDVPFSIGDLTVNPMSVSHDAVHPVGYRFSDGRSRAAVCTDLGMYDDYTVECLKGLDALLLEANHDVDLLRRGPYPWPLKQRILGERGHLSNENAGALLARVLHDNFKKVVLGHLSQENNRPWLALETVRMQIDLADIPYSSDDFPVEVAARDQISKPVLF